MWSRKTLECTGNETLVLQRGKARNLMEEEPVDLVDRDARVRHRLLQHLIKHFLA